MADLRVLAGADLRWTRSRWLPPAFRISWNEQEIGSLEWEGFFTSRAVARLGEGAWRFRRQGLRGVLVEDLGSGDVVAAMRLRLFGAGTVELPDGRHFDLLRAGLLPPRWSFVDALGSELVGVRARALTLFRGGTCRIEPAGAEIPEAALLALLGIYTLVRRARRRARNSG